MPTHRGGFFTPLKISAAAVMFLVTSLSCQGTEESPTGETGEIAAQRLTPRALEASTDPGAWALFDRDTAIGWRPSANRGHTDVTAQLDARAEVAALKVFGPSPYRLSLLDALGQRISGPHDLTALPHGWSVLPLQAPQRMARLILRFEPSHENEAVVPEVELWGTSEALPLAWEPSTTSGEVPPAALADVLPVTPESESLSREPTSGLSGCTTLSFQLARHPGTYRRAWLSYHAEGVFRPLVLTRGINGGPRMLGFWVPPTAEASGEEARTFVHPIDTEQLRFGHNEVEFCLPSEARGTIKLGAVKLMAELDHGSNAIESASIAPFDAIPTQGAMALLREGGEAVTVAAGQELVVAFERWISPDVVRIAAGSEVTWSLRCVDADAVAHDLPASRLEVTPGMTEYAIGDAGSVRCAGLRLRPSADVSVTRLRVFGSGAARRIDFPRIVLASAREHFGHEAWVEGWARAPSHVSGGVRVSIDSRETDGTAGVFASMLRRTTKPDEAWPVTVTARFADGSTFTRQFVLDRDAGLMPGAATRDPVLNDGLTQEERRARYGDVGQLAEAEVAPGQAKRIELGTRVSVDVPATAMKGRKRVSLKQLDASQLPPLDPGLVNVTAPFRRAYEFQPHGETFDDALKVSLPYQPSLVPPGYVPEDIQTFYYDETLKRWEPLARAGVARDREVVESLTDHFTTMINAIVVAPEHPQIASFDPNRLKGIKAATPSAGIQLIQPPQVSSNGDAALNYPLELPPGRLGVQPSFALGYSSARGNGWMGLGWDIGLSAIEAETRWGVPRYDASLETETYLFDGAQLSPTAHRSLPSPRSTGDKVFHPRIEGSFQRIVRHGTGPSRYWWEVTDRKGTRYFYGGTPETGRVSSACLTDDEGNVFRWALREIRDTHGNRVRFDYDTVTWSAPEQVPGRDLYLSSAHYTLRVGETTAPYRVVFLREPACTPERQTGCRRDLIVSGRGGFKQVTSERLSRVEVHYRQTLVRAWDLDYDQGPFGKSRLKKLTQFGVNNRPFLGNVHTFEYFDEVTRTSTVYDGFAPEQAWNAGPEKPDTGLALPDGFYDAIGEADASALGGSRTRSFGGHLYVGVGFGMTKGLSVGAKVGRRSDDTKGRVVLADINGDGLADRVFRGAGGGYFFNRNQSGPAGSASFATSAVPVEGLPALSHERSLMSLSVGPEAYFTPGQFHANLAFSSSEQDTYLSDVNADGLVDLVQGSAVYFNWRRADGLPRFVPGDSSGTPVHIGASAVAPGALPASLEDPEFEAELDRHAPPVDVVRSWQAPYPGRVRISGEVRLSRAQRSGGDGFRATIEHAIEPEGNQLWAHVFGPAETRPQNPSVEVDVAAGERILFRVHALENEWDDRVNWSPVVEYMGLAPDKDENRLDVHRFDATAEFALAGRANTGMNVPYSGTMRVSGRLTKLRETSDDITVMLMVDGKPAFAQVLPHSSRSTVNLDQAISVNARNFVSLRIHSDSPVDLTALAFEPISGTDGKPRHGPWIRYTSARNEDGRAVPVVDHQGKPIFDIPLVYDMTTYSLRTPVSPAPAFVPTVSGNFPLVATVDAGSTLHTGTVTFTAKSQGRLLGKRQVTIDKGGIHTMNLDVQVTANEPVFFSFSVSTPELFDAVRTTVSKGIIPLPSIRYGVERPGRLSHGYRGWAYGGYNGGEARGEKPIPPTELDKPPPFDGTETINEDTAADMARRFSEEGMRAFSLLPMADTLPCRYTEEDPFECSPVRGGHWQGPHELIYVTATEMSTTRLGGPLPRLPKPAQLAGTPAVPRISRSRNTAVGGGAGPASFSMSDGKSRGLLDYLDMNGDGFPDVVSPERVQYTSPLGVLAELREVPSRELRINSSESSTFGIGGNISSAIATARGLIGGGAEKTGGGSASTQQMQPVGFSLSLGASKGDATSEADLMDVNGDGLPDRVWKGAGTLDVSLNLGYRFAAREPWGQAVIHEGVTEEKNAGASLGFNDGVYGFGGGINGSNSQSGVKPGGGSLLDVNGDGLLDYATQDAAGLRVWFNQGHRIAANPVIWSGGTGSKEISENQSTTLGGGAYFTISIPVFVGISLIINPGADFGESVGRPTVSIQDINGDGHPDHLVSSNPHEIKVARNRTGRTDLLRHVKRPLGAEFWLDYVRTGNTQDMPQSRWALSEVKVYDGQADSAELGKVTDYSLQRMRYEGGRYDRYEREFYGFARVEVDTLDTRGWNGVSDSSTLPVYRRQKLEFRNNGYHERGLMAASQLLGGDGSVFERATYQYELRDIENGLVLTAEQAARTEAVFPAQVEEHHYQHEGDAKAFIHTFTTQDYDSYGNVISLHDAGGPGTSDDYRAEIKYTGRLSTCRAHHIVGVADSIIVRDAAGTLLRKREADVDCASGTGNVRQIRVSLDSDTAAHTDLSYDTDGNLKSVTSPPNHNGQRYQLRYTHDDEVRTHVVRIDDSFGYYSTAGYDLRFGAPTSEIDINGNPVLTEYDDFGRISRVRGPYEIERGLDYTIRFAYRPDAVVPYATSANMDVFRNVTDPIETVTFVDGLGRAIQTKKDGTLHRGVDAAAQDAMIVSGRTHLDPWGRVIARWYPTEEPKSTARNLSFTRPVDTSAPPTRITHDLLDRELLVVMPDDARTQRTYSLGSALSGGGLWALTTTIDAENNRRDAWRDARDNIRAVVEYLDGRGITTRYEYDPLKQIRRVLDAAGNLTRSDYDLAGRRTDVVHPDSGHTEMAYDEAGNIIRRITANLRREGGAIEYRYDFTHLTEIRYPRYHDNDVTYAWGGASLRDQGGNRVGRIVRVDDNSGFEERRYGALGETVYERRSIDSRTMGNSSNSPEIYVTRYIYDTWGRLQQMVYPDTEVLTYSYDSGGQVRAVEGVKLGVRFPYVTRLEYDRFDQREFLQTGNGIRTHYGHDARSRRLATLAAGEFQRFTYKFDKVGNVTNLVNDVPHARPNEYGGRVEQIFSYDDLYRLTSATGTWFQPPGKSNEYSYVLQYDEIHKIKLKNQQHWIRNRSDSKPIPQHKTTYAWNYDYGSAKPHAATHIGDRTFFYDDNGNQTGWDDDRNGQRRTIVWDEENRVHSISDNGRTTRFVYDDGGDRIIKTGAQGETVYVNDKWTVRNRSVGTKHVHVGTMRIASKLSPGDAHVRPDDHDLVSMMLGKWWEHRSVNGHQSGRNVEKNPHYEVPSEMPDDGMPDTNFLYFYHSDYIGSTSYVTDVDGELYEHMQYFPSGEPWVDQRSNTERLPHLFTSKELDQETGLHYFGARYYDPRVGLWTSTDPASSDYLDGQAGFGGVYQPVNLSTYAYAGHNPQTYIDPDGRIVWLPVLAAAWAITEVGLAAYDAYNAYQTINDPNATTFDKGIAVGGVLLSAPLPGGGYGAIGKLGKEVVEETFEQGFKQGSREVAEKVASETSQFIDDAAKKAGNRRGPKTDPNAPHNAKIREEADRLETEGNTIIAGGGRAKERLIPTPGGSKSGRRPDILYETPDGKIQGRNIGKTKADGSPVPREVDALNDLNGPGGVPTDFVPYDR
ncbi:MAG TPA: SpvB/TcaC N-terminal domain-containing protein [Archangium sp.]|uniref:SpvB/TcaC N-terminal domain-containing protein n=1 Tax=Archangium sp. TaxID=1872627 RepID=UPI002E2F0CB4|nr:SpvB/TcaC N-terminal domain-containing protein [Archangium sp.]HEX5745450.1 SpvB/TcaC N-terminal domain-containing protein [Archangium sp.]